MRAGSTPFEYLTATSASPAEIRSARLESTSIRSGAAGACAWAAGTAIAKVSGARVSARRYIRVPTAGEQPNLRVAMQRNPRRNQADPGDLGGRRNLRQHDDPDHDRRGRQQ